MALIIRTNGECKLIDKKELNLLGMQRIVGGLIQIVPIHGYGLSLVINEEGKLDELPENALCTRMYDNELDYIVGDCILIADGEVD